MVEVEKFGKDHWSTFAYIETRCVDHKGYPDRRHMRCDMDRHPAHVHLVDPKMAAAKYPTILKGGIELPDHDDWDCLDDCEAAGLLESHGTGLHPFYKLTKEGNRIAGLLREHKASGGTFGNFQK